MKKYTYLIALLVVITAISCKKVLTTEPRQSITPEVALTTPAGVNSLLNSIYTSFGASANYGLSRILLPEVLADNVINTTTNNNSYRNQEANQLGTTYGDWSNNYNIIFRTNLVIDAVDNGILLGATDAQKANFKGEALFFRSLAYFQLMISYGYIPGNEVDGWKLGVPIMLKPTKSLDEVEYPARNTNTEVYTLIKNDLATSISLLTNNTRASKAYISKAAAQALLSRVSLYTLDLDATITNSTAVLTTTSINGVSTSVAQTGADLVSMWRTYKNKSEAIWQISKNLPDNLGTGSIQSWFSIYPKPVNSGSTGNPARISFGDLRVAPAFLALFNASDIRRTQLMDGPYTKNGQAGLYYSNKYSGTGSTETYGLDDIVVFRTSEILLNRAEAYARKGDATSVASAIADVNVIRTRAGLTAIPTSTSAAAVLTEVLLQRRLELAFEGHRWYDLVRTKSNITKDPSGSYGNVTVDYTDRRILAQIPVGQIDVSKKILVQNPGY